MTDPVGLNAAMKAYGKALERAQADEEGGAVPKFGALLEQTLSQAVDAGRRSEAAAAAAVAGSAGLQEVVEAVNAAELALETVVAVRDRAIAAYQEILRMPI